MQCNANTSQDILIPIKSLAPAYLMHATFFPALQQQYPGYPLARCNSRICEQFVGRELLLSFPPGNAMS